MEMVTQEVTSYLVVKEEQPDMEIITGILLEVHPGDIHIMGMDSIMKHLVKLAVDQNDVITLVLG